MSGRFQIGEQSQLFQHLFCQILSLVDKENRIFPLGFLHDEKGIQGVDEVFGVIGIRVDAEFIVDGFEKL